MDLRAWAIFASALALTLVIGRSNPVAATMANHASSHDFDFLAGTWSIDNRRLMHPLASARHWVRFEATADERPILGGTGLIEQYDAAHAPVLALHGIALRLYDARSGIWSDYWSTAGDGTFSVPTAGGFKDGVGRFYDRETIAGRPVVVRFTWTRAGAAHCTWAQAFSVDGGKTWQDNWIMNFSRR